MSARIRPWTRDRWLLDVVSSVWLAAPFCVFALGWLRVWVAVPVVGLAAAGLWRGLDPAAAVPAPASPDDRRRALAAWALAAVLVFSAVLYSGTGGYAHQFGGHWRNNSFVKDLVEHSWPLGFEDVGSRHEPGVLAFYVANATLPAAVGRVLGLDAAFHFQFVWTCIGVFLALCWLLRVVGDRSPWWVLLFFAFGGLDLLGWWLFMGPYPGPRIELDLWTVFLAQRTPAMEGVFWILPSNVTILWNSPHHVLAAWLVLLMVLDDALHRGTSRRAGLLPAFALLWSAFSFVGLVPFVLAALVWTRGRGMASFENLGAGIAVLGVSALYLATNNGDYVSGPLWRFQDLRETGTILAAVCALEFGVYALLVPFVERRRTGIGHPAWLGVAVATLCLVPWIRLGDNNDFTTKASIPALLVLQVVVAHALADRPWRRRWAGIALVAVLLAGSVAPIVLVTRSVRMGLDASTPAAGAVAPTNELERCSRGGQLFGDGDALFWRVLARPIHHQPNEDWERPRGRWGSGGGCDRPR